MSEDTLTVTDNRTGETFEIEITDGTVKAMDFRQMKADEDDFGLMTYEPAFTKTASCRSAVTFIDGEKGILQHRGIPIEQLCEQSKLPRSRIPCDLRRAADRASARALVHRRHPPYVRPRGRQAASAGSATTPSDGHAGRRRRRALTSTRTQGDRRSRGALMAAIRLLAKMPTLRPSPSATTAASGTSTRTTPELTESSSR